MSQGDPYVMYGSHIINRQPQDKWQEGSVLCGIKILSVVLEIRDDRES